MFERFPQRFLKKLREFQALWALNTFDPDIDLAIATDFDFHLTF